MRQHRAIQSGLVILSLVLTMSVFSKNADDYKDHYAGIIKVKRKKTSKKKLSAITKSDKTGIKKFFKLNTLKTFEKVKKQNTLAFLVGNDKYKKKSDFAPLKQCYNDVVLLRQIFTKCIKMDPKNVHVNRDLKLNDFMERFSTFVEKVKKNPTAKVIITFSGHGNEDGSLVFVEGGMLKPNMLKMLVNSFPNDVILVIDACYSGQNEGPKEMLKGKKYQEFKQNSLRIYASLAHLTAKEIKYNNTFFSHIKDFYQNVLDIKHVTGNGYFTAMVGMFFAEYQFKEDENITFKDVVSYVTNRGKQYVEYLALWGKENKTQRKFASVRLNQQPKVLPIKRKVEFLDVNHQFFLIHKPIQDLGLSPGAVAGVFFPLGTFGGYFESPTIYAKLFADYELDFITKRLFLSANFGFMTMTKTSIQYSRDLSLSIIIPSGGFKYIPVKASFFSLSTALDFGSAITFSTIGSIGPIKEEAKTSNSFYFGSELALRFEVYHGLDIILPARFIYIDYPTQALYGFTTTIGATYYF